MDNNKQNMHTVFKLRLIYAILIILALIINYYLFCFFSANPLYVIKTDQPDVKFIIPLITFGLITGILIIQYLIFKKYIKTAIIFISKFQILHITIGTLIVFSIIGTYFIDIGINSKYFIEKDFNQAFVYRVTGNCDEFIKYVNPEHKFYWYSKCIEEKNRLTEPIREFKIQNISHTFVSDKAYIQVEIKRKENNSDRAYSVTYELKRHYLKWIIYTNPSL